MRRNQFAIRRHGDLVITGFDTGLRRQTNKRIPSKPLTPNHRLEQKTVGLICKFEIERQWRVEVGLKYPHERDSVIALRRKGFELSLRNHSDIPVKRRRVQIGIFR